MRRHPMQPDHQILPKQTVESLPEKTGPKKNQGNASQYIEEGQVGRRIYHSPHSNIFRFLKPVCKHILT